ncbi:MFS transporter [Streptomyces sp. NWU49]|nr:MFS transporter [Streptomyces sp. NWU49]
MRTFLHLLINTLVANLAAGFLWFALTFWVYLQTKNVMATGIIGGTYMLLIAVCSIPFGTIVDRSSRHRVFIIASALSSAAFAAAWLLYLLQPQSTLLDFQGSWFWLFVGMILAGAVVAQMRNIALSTTVTLLLPVDLHARANGMVGTVQGIAFLGTSVLSGIAIGFLGMGGALAIACVLTALSLAHVLFIRVPESGLGSDSGLHRPSTEDDEATPSGIVTAIRRVPGLMPLLLFSTFNNFAGGVYLALMDPYGLELMPVQWWGIAQAVASTGFLIGGAIVAARGLGRNPMRTMLTIVVVMGILGASMGLRDSWPLYIACIWLYMTMVPIVEATEQTVIQRVVPFAKQGRVFGFASALESSATPITAFLLAPIAQHLVIPHLESPVGQTQWGWLLGDGAARGMALIFVFAGLTIAAVAALGFLTKSYGKLSAIFHTVETTDAVAQ